MTADYIIEIVKLTKNYGENEVLKGLSFNVSRGEIFGLLGTNGAGKTTTLECLENFLPYDSGTITIKGTVGIQLQDASLPAYIKVEEAIQLFAKWKKATINQALLSELGINDIKKKTYLTLSTGQKRRLHLALTLLGEPTILFLDEPTAGLDVQGRIALHQEIRRLNANGTTIILTSHDMTEVENLCHRIAILVKGTIQFLGTTANLASRVARKHHITIQTATGEAYYSTSNISNELLKLLLKYKAEKQTVMDINVSRGSLEEHFIDISKQVST